MNYANPRSRSLLIFWVVEGVRRGLTNFAGTTEVSLILRREEFGNGFFVDDQQLLSRLDRDMLSTPINQKKAWNEEYLVVNKVFRWRVIPNGRKRGQQYEWFVRTKAFIDARIIKMWLDIATNVLHKGLESNSVDSSALSTLFLENLGPSIVGSILADLSRFQPDQMRQFKVTDALKMCARLSLSKEEGSSPTGNISFFDFVAKESLDLLLKFDQSIQFSDTKRIGKILQSVRKGGSLLSDYSGVIGISSKECPDRKAVLVSFTKGSGWVSCDEQVICRIVDGQFRSAQVVDALNEIENALQPDANEQCVQRVGGIVKYSVADRHGCTIVIDFAEPPAVIPGERLNEPLNWTESSDVVKNMAKIDGAMHLDGEGRLLAFGCLLDGQASLLEDRSRGARFNSALRFSQANADVCVIVVSSDGPLTIFRSGKVIHSDPFSRVDYYVVPEYGVNLLPVPDWLSDFH